jgi:hypothetical protein
VLDQLLDLPIATTAGGVQDHPRGLALHFGICLFAPSEGDDVDHDPAVNDSLDLRDGPRRDVGEGPAGLFLDVSIGVSHETAQAAHSPSFSGHFSVIDLEEDEVRRSWWTRLVLRADDVADCPESGLYNLP